MSDLPWVRFYASDWLAGTRGLSATEIGIYITLIAMMYERGVPLPENHDELRRLCGSTSSQFVRAISVLVDRGKLVRLDGCLWNRRVDHEHGLRIKQAVQHKMAATVRWAKEQRNQHPGDADAMHPQSKRNAIPDSKKDRLLTTSVLSTARPSLNGRSDRLQASLQRMGRLVGNETEPQAPQPDAAE